MCLTHGARLHTQKTLRINQLIKALWHQSLSRLQSRWTEISYIYQEQKKKNRPECITVIRDNVYRNHTQKTKKANTNLPLYIVKITPYFALEAAEGNKSKLSSFTSSSTPVFVEIPLFRF